jgi:hypothetical protein
MTNFIQLMEMNYTPYSSLKEQELLRLHVNLLHVPLNQTILNLKQPNIHNSNGDIRTGYSYV